jgi:hypothetical protein
MKGEHSFTITLKNNITEKEAIKFLIEENTQFLNPDAESRKKIFSFLEIDKKYSKAFDLILIPGHTSLDQIISLKRKEDIVLVELKTTQKKLVNNPTGFFFGATQNEFDLAEQLGENFKFCFVSLHQNSKSYKLLTLNELIIIIKNKRTQYQINL